LIAEKRKKGGEEKGGGGGEEKRAEGSRLGERSAKDLSMSFRSQKKKKKKKEERGSGVFLPPG